MFTSTGIISSSDVNQKQGWYYLKADEEISSYYNHFMLKKWNKCLNGCHLTFIAGEKDERLISSCEMIDFLHKEVEFYYTNQVWTNGLAFWVAALAPELDKIRLHLGIKPRFTYHLTLGNLKN